MIIEDLIQRDIKVIITTHHKRLATLMASNENVELIAALYDEENQKPTYEFYKEQLEGLMLLKQLLDMEYLLML